MEIHMLAGFFYGICAGMFGGGIAYIVGILFLMRRSAKPKTQKSEE